MESTPRGLFHYLWTGRLLIWNLADFSSNKGHIVQALGDVEINAAPGQAGAISHGGTGLGMSYDDKGYNVAGASPGEGFAFSKRYSGSSSPPLPALDSPGERGFDPTSAAVGAVGGAGAAATGAAACCACCVIL